MRQTCLVSLAVLLAAPALAEQATVTPGNTLTAAPAEWLGPTPHLVMMGDLAGHRLDVQYLDIGSADGVAEFAGKREYLAGDPVKYADFEVGLKAVIDGVEKAIELEFENADFAAHGLPARFALQGENFPEGLRSFLEASFEWEAGGASVNDEIGGLSGQLTLALDEGTPDDKGLLPDGLIGGHAVVEAEGQTLVISFTVPVAEYELED